MIDSLLTFFNKWKLRIILGGVFAIYVVISLLIMKILWNGRSFYKELSETQQDQISVLENQNLAKKEALEAYETLKKKIEKENKERLKLIEDSKNDKYVKEWMGIIAPSVLLSRLQ